MATQEMRILVRRDTEANWLAENPILSSGEWGYDETNKIYKMGDGTTVWADLPIGSPGGEDLPASSGTGLGVVSDGASGYELTDEPVIQNDDPRLSDPRTPTSHDHSTNDVTSGTFPVARGGTGQSSLTAGRYLRGDGANGVQSRTNSEVRTDLGVPLESDAVMRSLGIVVVDHGNQTSTARPTASCVAWRGSVEPANALDGDIRIPTTA